jgi:hypothetical protein
LLAHFLLQNDSGRFPLILLVQAVLEKITSLYRRLGVDPEDTYFYIVFTYLTRFAGIISGILHRVYLERETYLLFSRR